VTNHEARARRSGAQRTAVGAFIVNASALGLAAIVEIIGSDEFIGSDFWGVLLAAGTSIAGIGAFFASTRSTTLHAVTIVVSVLAMFACLGFTLGGGHMFGPSPITRVATLIGAVAFGTATLGLILHSLTKDESWR
jgi:hypothetical protein